MLPGRSVAGGSRLPKKTAWIGYVLGRSVDQGERYGANSAEANTSPPAPGTSLILRYPPCPGFAVGVVPLAVVCRWEAPGKAQAASLAVWASTSHQFGMQGKGATSSAWWNRRDLREPRAPGGGTAGILRRLVEEGVGPHCANEPQCCCRGPVTPTPHTSPVPCRSHGCLGGRGHLAFVLQSRCVLHGARGRQRRAAPGRSAWGLPRAARRRATRCRPCSA